MRLTALLLAFTLVASAQQKRVVTDQMVRDVHRSALLIDAHNDVTTYTVDGQDIAKPGMIPEGTRSTHTDIPRLRAGGVGGVFFAVYVAANYAKDKTAAHRTLDMIDTVRTDIIAKYPDTFTFATSASEVEAAHKSGKIAALMGIEGGHAIEDSVRLLRDFYALGIRYMTLTHTNTNGWADSSGDITDPKVKHHNGLTEQGKGFIREMNRLGMIVDVSHTADKTFWDALETSKAPIFASHSSCKALADVPRNMTDDMITTLGKKGGVIQINFNCGFLKVTPTGGKPSATLADVVAHIDHAVQLAGIDSVGIGSDYDGVMCTPAGLEDVSKFPNLTRALLEKGYSAEAVRKIYGGNTLRLMRAVEKVRDEMKAAH
jgi:membrane dipeptidase